MNNDFSKIAFPKKYSLYGKGIAILLMLYHHLFIDPHRISPPNYYVPLFEVLNIELNIAIFGKVCVGIFLFLSGYGIANSIDNGRNKIFIRLWKVYQVYWYYFIVFIGIGYLFFDDGHLFDFSYLHFFGNFFGVFHDYNKEWWFLKFYVALVVASPWLFKVLSKSALTFMVLSIALHLGAPIWVAIPGSRDNLIFVFLSTLLTWQIYFASGMLFRKKDLFNKNIFKSLSKNACLNFISIIVLVFLRIIWRELEPLIIPLFIYLICSLVEKSFWVSKILVFFGEISFPLWLVHTFFAYYYFQYFIFSPHYSLLVYLNLVVVCSAVVMFLEWLRGQGLEVFLARFMVNQK